MAALLRRIGLLPRAPLSRSWATATIPTEEPSEELVLPDLSDEEAEQRIKKLEKSRNKSRLSHSHYNIIHGRRPYAEPKTTAHVTVKYHRKLLGKYGFESGVDPSLCWPTTEELEEIKEYERVAYPFTIQEMAATAQKKRQDQKRATLEREAAIAIKLEKVEQWKKDLMTKIAKKEAEVKAAKEKRERLVEEVRRHFGFKLDHRDERFQEMLAKREKEQKKLEKLAKREAKDKEVLAKIQQKKTSIETDLAK